MKESNAQDEQALADRIQDFEHTIGDIAATMYALLQRLKKFERPTCPPYCAHGTDCEPEGTLEERVTDIEHTIGDIGDVLYDLGNVLDDFRRPTCPPYCAHVSDPQRDGDGDKYKY